MLNDQRSDLDDLHARKRRAAVPSFEFEHLLDAGPSSPAAVALEASPGDADHGGLAQVGAVRPTPAWVLPRSRFARAGLDDDRLPILTKRRRRFGRG